MATIFDASAAGNLPPLPAETVARIEHVLLRNAQVIDDGLIDQWPLSFTEQGVYEITTRENVAAGYPLGIMLCEGRTMMRDRMAALQDANIYEEHVYTHMLGRSLIVGDAQQVQARTPFTVYRTLQGGDAHLFACGRLEDRLVLTDAGWQIAHRQVILDSRRVDTLLVLPL